MYRSTTRTTAVLHPACRAPRLVFDRCKQISIWHSPTGKMQRTSIATIAMHQRSSSSPLCEALQRLDNIHIIFERLLTDQAVHRSGAAYSTQPQSLHLRPGQRHSLLFATDSETNISLDCRDGRFPNATGLGILEKHNMILDVSNGEYQVGSSHFPPQELNLMTRLTPLLSRPLPA